MATTRSNTFGSNGGNSFDDSHDIDSWGPITQIIVRHGARVDAIGIGYANGNFINHGGTGGDEMRIDLAPGEIIGNVSGRSGAMLDQVTFTSNKAVYGPYGGGGGSPFEVNFNGKALQYIFGRAGGGMDQIGFAYGDPPPALPSTVERSGGHGGQGGDPFDDLSASGNLLGKIASIKVRHGAMVDKITVQYKGRGEYAHGGGGGDESTFDLDDDEWLTAVHRRSAAGLDQVQFFTSKGRVSPVFGGQGGAPFVESKDGHVIKALFGRSGGRVDQLGVYFEDAKPLKMLITAMDYDIDQAKILQMPPVAVMTTFLENKTIGPQQVAQHTTISVTDSTTTSVAENHGVSVEVTVSKDFQLVKSEIKVGYTYEKTVTTETSQQTSRENEFEFSAAVPANSTIRAMCIAKMDSFAIPWTATAQVTYQDRSEPVTKILRGRLTGVQTTAMEAIYEPV